MNRRHTKTCESDMTARLLVILAWVSAFRNRSPYPQAPAICPYPEPTPSSPHHPPPTSWRSILILSSHLRLGLPNGLFPSGFPTNTLYTAIILLSVAYLFHKNVIIFHCDPEPRDVFVPSWHEFECASTVEAGLLQGRTFMCSYWNW
jgi:hypothetical protein